MSERDLSRRSFLRSSITGVSLAALPTWFASEALAADMETESAAQRRIGPNDTIQVAAIGPGGPRGGYQQGLGVTRGMATKKGVKIVGACDVDQAHLDNAVKVFGADCKGHRDWREVIARKDVDAVVIGTPDHWHAVIAVAALQAGKDVYCEKPLTLTIAEGRRIANATQKGRRILQVGSQQRSDARFRMACELVRNGRIGKVTKVTTHLPTGPTGGPFDRKPVPREIDFNMWQGPAPEAHYCPERTHGSFRWWLEYSGGMLTDWGAHHNDIAHWALGMDASGPSSVMATGKSPAMVGHGYYNTYPEFDITYEYPDGVTMLCTNQGENGVMFEGTEGWIFVSRGRIGASNQALLDAPLPSSATRLYASNDHIQNFVDCVRDRQAPICTAEIGHRSATVCHLGNISLRLGGRKLMWDAAKERCTNSEEANHMLDRPYRKWD